MIRVLFVRLCDAVARWLRALADSVEHRGTLVYREHSRIEARKAARAEVSRMMQHERDVAATIDALITETRPVKRVGAPIHRKG